MIIVELCMLAPFACMLPIKKLVSAPFACVCHGWVPLRCSAQDSSTDMHAVLMQLDVEQSSRNLQPSSGSMC